MHTVGRLLRTFRIAAGLTLPDAAAAAALGIDRLRSLEAGQIELSYRDGMALAATYRFCNSCFYKHLRLGFARDEATEEPTDDD